MIAQTAILGSILVNALLVLGLVIVAGAARSHDGVMRFNPRLPNDTATLLLVASFIIVLIGLTHSAGDAASRHTRDDLDHRVVRDPRGLRAPGCAST